MSLSAFPGIEKTIRKFADAMKGGKAAARTTERCSRCHRIFRVNEACNIFDGALVCFDCEPIKAAPATPEPQGGGAPICPLCKEPDLAVNPVTGVIHRWSDCGIGFGPCPMQKPTPATPGEPDALWDAELARLEKWVHYVHERDVYDETVACELMEALQDLLAKLRSRGGEKP